MRRTMAEPTMSPSATGAEKFDVFRAADAAEAGCRWRRGLLAEPSLKSTFSTIPPGGGVAAPVIPAT